MWEDVKHDSNPFNKYTTYEIKNSKIAEKGPKKQICLDQEISLSYNSKKKTIKFEDFSYSKHFKKEFKTADLIESLILSKLIAMVFIFLVIIESSDAVAFSAL